MKVCALALLATSILLASDPRQLALALKAQSDFERVESVSRPRIPDAEVCMPVSYTHLTLPTIYSV